MVNDSVADLLTRIRNAQQVRHRHVEIPASKLVKSILDVLRSEGFVNNVETVSDKENPFDTIRVELKYFSGGEPAIGRAKSVSTPGRRVYKRSRDLPRVYSGLGVAIISTSQGVMSDREARKLKIGGEVLAEVGS